MTEYKIRQATIEDLEDLVDISVKFYQFSEYSFKLDREVVRSTVSKYLEKDNLDAIVFVLTFKDKIVGVISGMAVDSILSKDRMAVEQTWWVDEEHRGKYSLYLLDLLEQWAKAVGCKSLSMTSLEKNSAVSKIYEKKNYKLTELTYFKEF